MKMPMIAVIGRPNVGKSTLFNQFVGTKKSIVLDQPGVTRDSVSMEVDLFGRKVQMIDTGGIDDSPTKDPILNSVREMLESLLKEADCLVLVFDGRDGYLPADDDVLSKVRKLGKPIIGVINKIDPGNKINRAHEFEGRGLKSLLKISAEHRLGIGELYEEILSLLPEESEDEKIEPVQDNSLKIAFIGKPNVGKSSLVNTILNKNKMIVSEIAGTTRDTIDSKFDYEGREVVLLDTAGLRRKSKVHDDVEFYSTVRSNQAIGRADVVILVIDGLTNISTQDQKLAALILDEGKGLLIVYNKWDLCKDTEHLRSEFRKETQDRAAFVHFADTKFISAKTGEGVSSLLPACRSIMNRMKKSYDEEELKNAYRIIVDAHPPMGKKAHQIQIKRMTFLNRPVPSFYVRCNRPDWIPDELKTYWKNRLYEIFDLRGVPIRVVFHRHALEENKV